MNTEQIMALADAYASQLQVCNFADADKARDALEAAVLAQGDMSPASTHGKNVSMKQGFENIKQEPVAWGMLDAEGNVVDTITEDDRQRGMAKWADQYPQPLYTHPAPVNTALLEKAAQLACDAVASNGGSVQMEAHVRAAIAQAEGK